MKNIIGRSRPAIWVLYASLAFGWTVQQASPVWGTGPLQNTTPPVLQPHNPRYLLSIGDTFDITFRFTPEFNQTVTVQPDGYINIRELPDMHVAGMTTTEVSQALQKAYSHILHDPVITLLLKDFEKPYFIAGGEVGRPGKYDLRGETTVIQAIEMAGGFKESSKHSQVLVFHRVSDQWTKVMKLDVKEMLAAANLHEDPRLSPGDMIYVPKNTMSKIKPFLPTTSIGTYFPLPY
jgi:polysaccharide biosynthesis/export protein